MRLLIIDDEPGLAESLAQILKHGKRCTAISTATSFDEGLALAVKEKPDIALVDHHLGNESQTGTQLVAQLRLVAPLVKTIIITGDPSPETARRALADGADGYLLKEGICSRLNATLETVHAGGRYIDPVVSGAALLADAQQRRKNDLIVTLSPAQSDVLQFLAANLSYEQIAEKRRSKLETVKSQIHAIYEKLGVNSREDAIELARKLGLA
ncbi:MAG: response regulator transcription factor [Myxococcales bacterium]